MACCASREISLLQTVTSALVLYHETCILNLRNVTEATSCPAVESVGAGSESTGQPVLWSEFQRMSSAQIRLILSEASGYRLILTSQIVNIWSDCKHQNIVYTPDRFKSVGHSPNLSEPSGKVLTPTELHLLKLSDFNVDDRPRRMSSNSSDISPVV